MSRDLDGGKAVDRIVDPMPGMRERKKRERRDELIAAAIDLFRRRGYEQTTMEEIAARADVSAPTLYRYFPTKPDLLLGLFWQTRDEFKERLEYFHRNPSDDPVQAVADLIHSDMGDLRSQGDKRLWREIMAALLRSHDKANDEFQAYKAVFEVHLERLLIQLKAKQRLSSKLAVAPTVAVLYAVASEVFSRLIANEFVSSEDTRATIEEQVRVVLQGWATPPRPAKGPSRPAVRRQAKRRRQAR